MNFRRGNPVRDKGPVARDQISDKNAPEKRSGATALKERP
jgi:hypothetical protein